MFLKRRRNERMTDRLNRVAGDPAFVQHTLMELGRNGHDPTLGEILGYIRRNRRRWFEERARPRAAGGR